MYTKPVCLYRRKLFKRNMASINSTPRVRHGFKALLKEMFSSQFFGLFLFNFLVLLLVFLITPSLLAWKRQHLSLIFDEHVELTTQRPVLTKNVKRLEACLDRELYFEKTRYGDYWLLRNLIIGLKSKNMKCDETITYTTSCDYTSLESLPIVLESWMAPVSVALFAPGFDFNKTMQSIQYLRNCMPESELIRDFVTFHIYFPNKHIPKYIPLNETEATAWKYICDDPAPFMNVNRSELYKTKANLHFPINVGRNIARKSANTYFIFACDIELIPSPGLVPQFLEMITNNIKILHGNKGLRVFALPIFEVYENATIPSSKTELKDMLATKTAIPYHLMICKLCHSWPNQTLWLKTSDQKRLSITTVGKRQGVLRYWEPFYISNNKEPMYDERVTWEGQSNRRIQNFAMCLLDYEYHLLHPAFLTHVPGIKYIEKGSMTHVPAMNHIIKYKIEPEYRIFYGHNTKCHK